MKNLNKLYHECLFDVHSLGINTGKINSITINNRAKKRWGQTTKHTDGSFSININGSLLNDSLDDMAAKNTIAHEILHTCKGCFDHQALWQSYADKMNSAYGYNIKRCTSAAEKGLESVGRIRNESYKYTITCTCCGGKTYYKRASKVIQHPEWFRCGRCNGKLKVADLVI